VSQNNPDKAAPPVTAHEYVMAREQARAARDFARADELRTELLAMGWLVTDTAAGPVLSPAPKFIVHDRASGDGSELGASAKVLITVLVHGWQADADACVTALLKHETVDYQILIVDIANQDDVGDWAESLARAHPARVSVLHLSAVADHWGRIHVDLMNRCSSEYYCVIDPSSVVSGPAITHLCEVLDANPDIVADGWRGADVDVADNWRNVTNADGSVDVLLSYLMVIRANVARIVSPDSKARFYRNADIEWSLKIRDWHVGTYGTSAQFWAVGDALPVTQGRHHGYHDTDPELRDRESRKTYDRILQHYRGRMDILKPR